MEPPRGSPDRARPTKRRRVNEDGQERPSVASWENIHGHDNSRMQNGHVYNHTYNGPVYRDSNVGAFRSSELDEYHTKPSEDLIETLSFDEMYDRYDDIDPVYSGTCQWFFDGAEYKAWHDPDKMNDHHGFLWIVGKPGAGKSTLMKDALIRGRNTFGQEEHHTTVSFFFDARAGESGQLLQKSLQGLFRSLLYQLLKAQPQVAAGLEGRRITRAKEQGWPLKSLQGLFRDAVLSLGTHKLTCYIDALDECEESEARKMVSFFEDLAASSVAKSGHFYVLLSSRHYPRIAISHCQKMILEDQEGHAEDIKRYIKNKLRIRHSKEAQKFRVAMQKKASGVFMWVVLVVRSLDAKFAGGERLEQLYQHLNEIPGDLHDLFADILKRGSHNRSVLLLTLQWLMFARRPLTRDELYCAIWYDSRPETIQPWDPAAVTAKDMNKFLLDHSKGLTEMTRHKPPKVRFIHESVRDYLRSAGFRLLDSHVSENLLGQCHDRLKKCCHQYVLRSAPELLSLATTGTKAMSKLKTDIEKLRVETTSSYPFLSYALEGMIYHADASHAARQPQHEYVLWFPRQQWARLQNLLAIRAKDWFSESVSKDYIFALNGAAHLTDIWVRANGICANRGEKQKSTLCAAIVSGHSDVVQLLLDHQADPNLRIPSRGRVINCLLYALDHGYTQIAKSLINAGADLNTDHLCSAAQRAQQDVAEMLLERGVSTSRQDSAGDTALQHAARSGSLSVVSLLLNRGADVNVATVYSWDLTVLQCAVHNADPSVVSLLLDRGAKILGSSSKGQTALHEAAAEGNQAVVSMLLDRGAKIDCQDNYGETALHKAAKRALEDNHDTVRTLLDSGADVYGMNDDGNTPLHIAVRFGETAVARVLLDHMSMADDTRYSSVIDKAETIAREKGREEILRMLLQHRARF